MQLMEGIGKKRSELGGYLNLRMEEMRGANLINVARWENGCRGDGVEGLWGK